MTRKQVGKESVYLAYTSVLLFIIEESQDRYMEVVTDAEPIEGCYWFAPYGLHSLLSYEAQEPA